MVVKKGRVMEVKVNLAEEGGWINWSEEVEQEDPPSWWSKYEMEQEERQKKPEKVVKVKKEVKIKKETTYPYYMRLGSYLALQLGEEGMKKLQREEGVRTVEKLEERYKKHIMREPGVCNNPSIEASRAFDVEKLGEGALQRLIQKWESGPQIVSIGEGDKAQLCVVMLAMGPNNSSSPHIFAPIIKEEQASQDRGRGHSRGVKEEVRNH